MDSSGREALGTELSSSVSLQLVQTGFHCCSGWEDCIFNPVHWNSLEGNVFFVALCDGQAAFIEQTSARRDSCAGAIATV